MRTFYIMLLLSGWSLNARAQDPVQEAAHSACNCLKDLELESLSKKDINLSVLGCVSRPIDDIAVELKKQGMWSDSSVFEYLGKVGDAARKSCPEVFQKVQEAVKSKEVHIDPALVMIPKDSETVTGFAEAVCRCMEVVKNLEECTKQVGTVNEEELKRRFPDSEAFTIMMGIGTDMMFELADHCEAAANHESIAAIKRLPAATEGCSKLILGDYVTETILGETRSTFTSDRLKEYSNGKLSAEYELKWSGCSLNMKCISSKSGMVKKGDVSTLEIRRASEAGFIALASFGSLKVPVNYNKVK